jgi:PGF-CTERM protein
MRKIAGLAVFMALMMLVPVQAGGNVTTQQADAEEDIRQPTKENKTLYMYWDDSNTKAWTHFSNNDSSSLEEYFEEKDNGVINIDLQFRMDPMLDKRLIIEEGGLFRGSFTISVEGDWTNDNDGQTACGQNDCEELNITLLAGPNEIGTHHETGLVAGDNQVVFNFAVEEDTIKDWDKADYNPVIKVEMKLAGNRQQGGILGLQQSGEPASFSMKMGESSYLEFPIDDASWDESIQDGGDIDGGSSTSEDAPGFTLVVASAAIAMAVFVNSRREDEEN